jgi:Ca2+-binding RTX toxin-like protein
MKTSLLILLVLLGGTIVPPSAGAGTITYDAGAFAYRAGPGEGNHIRLERTTSCETLAAPCLRFSDVTFSPVTVPTACVDAGFNGVICPLPTAVRVDLGDRIDYYHDWDGPSQIHAGPGDDVVYGSGGNDAVFGDEGGDSVVGGPGDDRVDGGPGDDYLDWYLIDADWPAEVTDSAGTDVLVGGSGADTMSYDLRADPLVISKNGRADDGAPGERDNLTDDVEEVRGGHGDDALVGGPRADFLRGAEGDDVITGAGGEDYVDGGHDDDAVAGGAGDDEVAGGGGSDLVVGGPGSDVLLGEYLLGCARSRIGCLDGDDEIRADDGTSDGIECGGGDDTATVDRIDVLATLASCDRVAAVGSPCAGLPRSVKPVCRLVVRAIDACANARGAKKKRCLKRAVRKASASCRKRFRGRQRRSCLRSVRELVK